MKKSRILVIIVAILFLGGLVGLLLKSLYQPKETVHTESVALKTVSSQIVANGYITAENQATLHFPIGGKVVYLPFKEGDSIYQGQTIASLDQRTIADTIKSTVDAYQNQKTQFDTVNDFNGNRGLNDLSLSTSAYRQLSTAINTLDQTQLAVEIQKIAQEQAILTSPITGIVTHEDVTLPYQNVTPATGFTVMDPSTTVFRANITDNDIDFVQVGAGAKITLSGNKKSTFTGTVVKIFPTKITLSNGQKSYQVDIQSDDMKNVAKFDQNGTVLIDTAKTGASSLIPTWTILAHHYVWIENGGKLVLKQVELGQTHGSMTEVVSGLDKNDRVIINPQSIAGEKYQLL